MKGKRILVDEDFAAMMKAEAAKSKQTLQNFSRSLLEEDDDGFNLFKKR